ncbi:MAG TPA: TIGR03560 family F420-dependent LLM class oxidoreductase [Nitrosopumilaceae archaeon]|jgi:F420-dependent oxidoreductase-like protein|nr:TIGR03560 family F420-dependent LLM class oxidoreductase [Nitrosopumilaceae archaeon]
MKSIQVGLTLPQGWLDEFPDNNAYDQFLFSKSVALRAEQLGYDAGYVYDHFIPYYGDKRTLPFFEAYTLLSAITSITTKLRVGQVVTCNSYRSPSLLAKMSSTLDAISNGRLEFGIGAGWFEHEYNSYGYQFDSASTRIEQLDESLIIIKKMWQKEKASFKGKHYSIKNAICSPKPIQEPHPPIMVGGAGQKLIAVAAKHATRYNHPFGTPEILLSKIEMLKTQCKKTKRNFDEIENSVLLRVLVGKDKDDLKQIVAQLKKKNESISEFIMRSKDSIALGTPNEVIEHLQKYVNIGISYFIVNFIGLSNSLEMLSLFSKKVRPRL